MIPFLQALTFLCCIIVYEVYCRIDDKIKDNKFKAEQKKQREKERLDWQNRKPDSDIGKVYCGTIKPL